MPRNCLMPPDRDFWLWLLHHENSDAVERVIARMVLLVAR
jgi:hypothetical protein